MIGIARDVLDVMFASLWQGAVLAIAVFVFLALAGRRLNAATRSIVLQVALLAIALVPLLTTLPYVLPHTPSATADAVTRPASAQDVMSMNGLPTATPHRIDVTSSDPAVLTLTGAWVLGVLIFALRLGAGSLQLARLVRRSRRLREHGGVPLYASPDIGVPLAFGLTSPSIIVPTALAAAAGDEFECIVLHELAHVRRRDAWANACERILHVFLFFNPAVLLVLRAIARERESACDDWAVAQSRDLDTYTRSLASFAISGARAGTVYACGATGFAGATVARIRRLEDTRRNGAITLSRYALGSFTIVLLFLALTLHSFAPAIAFAPQTAVAPAVVASARCNRRRFHLPPAPHTMKKMVIRVEMRSTASGKFEPKVVHSSGDAAYDRAVLAEFKNSIPCNKAGAAAFHFDVQAEKVTSGRA